MHNLIKLSGIFWAAIVLMSSVKSLAPEFLHAEPVGVVPIIKGVGKPVPSPRAPPHSRRPSHLRKLCQVLIYRCGFDVTWCACGTSLLLRCIGIVLGTATRE